MTNYAHQQKCTYLLKTFVPLLISVLILFLSIGTPSEAAKARQLRYYALDVGQGDCSLFVLPDGRNVVIDAGPRSNARKTVNYLKSCGVRKIDLLIATHPHEDHIGGMKELLARIPVKQIWDSGYNHGSKIQRDFYLAVKDKKIPFGRPKRGYAAKLGDVTFEVLAPARALKGTSSDANNNGLIVLVTYGDVSFLMMGDAQKEEQETVSPLPRAAVLKAAHHGAANGTDAALLRDVSPDIVILSYKRGNSYGHPHRETVAAIRKGGNSYGHPHRETVAAIRKAKLLRFDTADGPVKLRTDGKSVTFERKRVVK